MLIGVAAGVAGLADRRFTTDISARVEWPL
jgi:hypothetical protein